MAVAMSLWSFQQYPEDDPIKFLGGDLDDMTYSDEELDNQNLFSGDIDELEPQLGRLSEDELDTQLVDNIFGEVEIEDNPFEVDISEED